LKVPVETRWNSTLEGLKQLLELYDEKPAEMLTLYEQCNIDNHLLRRDQLEFLRRYVKVNSSRSEIHRYKLIPIRLGQT
jgi:hypothetical protein